MTCDADRTDLATLDLIDLDLHAPDVYNFNLLEVSLVIWAQMEHLALTDSSFEHCPSNDCLLFISY